MIGINWNSGISIIPVPNGGPEIRGINAMTAKDVSRTCPKCAASMSPHFSTEVKTASPSLYLYRCNCGHSEHCSLPARHDPDLSNSSKNQI